MRANVLNAAGETTEAEGVLTEVLDPGEGAIAFVQQDGMADSLMDVAWLAHDIGREEQLRSLLEASEESAWAEPALAILRGDAASAADTLERLRSDAAAAYARHHGGLELIAQGKTDDWTVAPAKGARVLPEGRCQKVRRGGRRALGHRRSVPAEPQA